TAAYNASVRYTSLSSLSLAAPTPEPYTLSLHDALPILHRAAAPAHQRLHRGHPRGGQVDHGLVLDRELLLDQRPLQVGGELQTRSEEHTSELQSRENLVCRLLLEKKKNNQRKLHTELYA